MNKKGVKHGTSKKDVEVSRRKRTRLATMAMGDDMMIERESGKERGDKGRERNWHCGK